MTGPHRDGAALAALDVNVVAVVGAGTMGAGIAQTFAETGAEVRLHDREATRLARAGDVVAAGLRRAADKGRIPADAAEAAADAVHLDADLSDAVAKADLIFEAVYEDPAVKRTVWAAIEQAAPTAALLCTNTSQIRISAIAEALADRRRLFGTHWFVPAHHMPLVEVAVPDGADEAAVDRLLAVLAAVGKDTIRCRDAQGFVTSRANMALFAECFRIVEEGVAAPADVDKALRLGLGHAMGVFQVCDLSGADVVLAAMEGLRGEYGDRFLPTQGLRRRVSAGNLGNKTGGGFYRPDKEEE